MKTPPPTVQHDHMRRPLNLTTFRRALFHASLAAYGLLALAGGVVPLFLVVDLGQVTGPSFSLLQASAISGYRRNSLSRSPLFALKSVAFDAT